MTQEGPAPTGRGAGDEDRRELLARRYGVRTSPQQRRRRTVAVASVVALLGAALVMWLAGGPLDPDVTTTEVGFTVHDESSIEVVFDVSMPPGRIATCTVEALSSGFGQVGLLDVEVGPSEDRVVRVRVDVATSELAATGVVRDCVLHD